MTSLEWPQLERRYQELEHQAAGQAPASDWLESWSELIKSVQEENARLLWAAQRDLRDEAAQQAYASFSQNLYPQSQAWDQRLEQRYLAATDHDPSLDLQNLRTRFAARRLKQADEVMALEGEASRLAQNFSTLQGQLQPLLEGQKVSLGHIIGQMNVPERQERERAWRAYTAARVAQYPAVGSLFTELVDLRHRIAHLAGRAGPLDFAWQKLERLDYTHEVVQRFRTQVKTHVLPVFHQFRNRRKQLLGVDALRPWDLQVNPFGQAPVASFSTVQEWGALTAEVLERLHPRWSLLFKEMLESGYVDMEDRPGKANRIFSEHLPHSHHALVFGCLRANPGTLSGCLHEVGHGLHLSLFDPRALTWHQRPPLEFLECIAQTMELLCLEHYDHFFESSALPQLRHLSAERVLGSLVSATMFDHFQERLYALPEPTQLAQIEAVYLATAAEYSNGLDWSGLEEERPFEWPQGHFFYEPFYMIEYAFAWTGALDLLAQFRANPQDVVAHLTLAMEAGNRLPLPDLFALAGTQMVPGDDAMMRLCRHLEREAVS